MHLLWQVLLLYYIIGGVIIYFFVPLLHWGCHFSVAGVHLQKTFLELLKSVLGPESIKILISLDGTDYYKDTGV